MRTHTGPAYRSLNFLCCLTLLFGLGTSLKAADEKEDKAIESGPQVGERARPYHPLLATGQHPGQRWCMVCTHAGRGNSMVIAFLRDPKAEASIALIAAVEAAAKKHKQVGGIVTLLTTEGKSAKQAEALTGEKVVYINSGEKAQFAALQKLAKAKKITNSNLNIYVKAGPAGYGLAPEAEATILVVDRNTKVLANIALRKSELTKEQVKAVAKKIDQALSGK